jgi:hypothetical protein
MDPAVKDKILRLLLRSLPVFPGPEVYDLLRQVKRAQGDIDEQVQEALDGIKKTSELVGRLESSLKDRAEKLQRLRNEHERYSELAQIEGKKAEALMAQLEATLGKNLGRERWIAFAINIIAGLILFILGVALSDQLKQYLGRWF